MVYLIPVMAYLFRSLIASLQVGCVALTNTFLTRFCRLFLRPINFGSFLIIAVFSGVAIQSMNGLKCKFISAFPLIREKVVGMDGVRSVTCFIDSPLFCRHLTVATVKWWNFKYLPKYLHLLTQRHISSLEGWQNLLQFAPSLLSSLQYSPIFQSTKSKRDMSRFTSG